MPQVPICVIDGEVFNDSTDIVDKIHDVVASDGGRAAARCVALVPACRIDNET
jgi:hypothetical protein